MKTDIFCQAIADVLRKEHKLLADIHEQSIFTLPKTVVRYLCAKGIYEQSQSIFPEGAIWKWQSEKLNSASQFITFSFKEKDSTHLLIAEVLPLGIDDDVLSHIEHMLQFIEPHKKLICILLQGTDKQVDVWTEKWNEVMGGFLQPLQEKAYIGKLKNGSETELWLVTWQSVIPEESDDVHSNAMRAMKDAVHGMHFENMMQLIKRIITLRTNIDEAWLNTETQISTIFKLVFAKEQGVELGEVYDPEAMAGLTDSQLAANNFVNDMQKAFNIDFTGNEFDSIKTIGDLVEGIIFKKSF